MELNTETEVDVDISGNTNGTKLFFLNHSFDTFENLSKRVEVYAKEHGFSTAKSTHRFSKDRTLAETGVTDARMVSRGYFYCRSRKDDCPFKVRFTWNVTDKVYSVVEIDSAHNHDLEQGVRINLHGKEFVQFEHQLELPEKQELIRLGSSGIGITVARSILQTKFTSREYADQLLRRQLKKGKLFSGSDVKDTTEALDSVLLLPQAISSRDAVVRSATAETTVLLPAAVVGYLQQAFDSRSNDVITAKGSVFATATMAGMMGVKQTSNLVPFCIPFLFESCEFNFKNSIFQNSEQSKQLLIRCCLKSRSRAGVDIGALTGVSIAALTIYDMLKDVSLDIKLLETRLVEKTGWKRKRKTPSMGS